MINITNSKLIILLFFVETIIILYITHYVQDRISFLYSLVCIKLKPLLLERSSIYQEIDANFRSYTRAILGIGCNLHRSRDLRFFFLELVERCIEPWRQVNWTHTDLRNFLSVYTQCALDMDVLR